MATIQELSVKTATNVPIILYITFSIYHLLTLSLCPYYSTPSSSQYVLILLAAGTRL